MISHSFATPLLYSGSLSSKLPSLSPECRAALAGIHFTVDRVSEHSYIKSRAWTDASRVSWYRDNFCKRCKIVDHYLLDVNNYQETNLLFACYAVVIALGHTLLCKTIKSATINNYLRAAANVVKQTCSQVPNPTNNLRWHDPLLDMTTGKT
jgi:hypothetical protein